MPESSIVDACEAELDQRGAWHQKIWGSSLMARGIPDILACWQGRFIAIECKQPGRRPTRIQALVHHRIRQAGGTVVVAHTRQELADALDRLARDHPVAA